MKKPFPLWPLAVVLVLLYALVWHWQTPGRPLSKEEVAAYLARMEPALPMAGEEKRVFLARMRAWGEADDGKAVFMANLMRYRPQIVDVPGGASIAGTPRAANDHYEDATLPMVLKLGAYPLSAGDVVGIDEGGSRHSNVAGFGPTLDDWGRILLMRYPSRRAFFELIADPEYLKVMPWKLAAMDVALTPTEGTIIVPDVRLALAALFVMLFLAVGWWRAATRRAAP